MRTLNKKGQDVSINWIVGLLAGVMISGILLALGLQWYQTTTKTKESFTTLTADIEAMKDGDSTTLPYYLPGGYILVSFTGGKDFDAQAPDLPGVSLKTGQSCSGLIQIPKSCGSSPCLCVCDGSYRYGYENSCIDKPLTCYPFTSEVTKSLSFYDSDCSTGVYRPGPENGIFSLYVQREKNTIKLCSTESCVNENDQEIVSQFKTYVEKYNSCATSSSCSCSVDLSFLGSRYALIFKSGQIGLQDIYDSRLVSTISTQTQTTLQFPDEMVLYSMSIAGAPNVVGTSSVQDWTLSPTVTDIQTSAYQTTFYDETFSTSHILVQAQPRVQHGVISFVSKSTAPCTDMQSTNGLFA